MKGLQESRKSFEASFDKLFEAYPELKQRAACGLCGRGSQCLGYDDEISRDHDVENGFIIWLCDDDFEKFGYLIKKEYQRLFASHKEDSIYGIYSVGEFIKSTVSAVPQSPIDWLNIPEHALLSATNGEIFYDGAGEISNIRNTIKNCPKDVFIKRASAHLSLASQAGEYNFSRLMERGDIGSATLAIAEFVKHIIYATHAIYQCFTPFYKWQLRSLSEFDEELCSKLNMLLLSQKSYSQLENNLHTIALIAKHIKNIANLPIKSDSLGDMAIYMQSLISDKSLNSLHLMDYGVE